MKGYRHHSKLLILELICTSESTLSCLFVPLPKKAHDFWIWIALCRKTRQVVAYASQVIGAKKPVCACGKPFHQQARRGHCFTDFWAAYAAVIPEEQHTAVGKETGETAHVERWNNTLRQRLARFVRMTLSFSKSVVMLRPHVCFSFSIDRIEIRLSRSSEPLLHPLLRVFSHHPAPSMALLG